jgi:hypothetical protein
MVEVIETNQCYDTIRKKQDGCSRNMGALLSWFYNTSSSTTLIPARSPKLHKLLKVDGGGGVRNLHHSSTYGFGNIP